MTKWRLLSPDERVALGYARTNRRYVKANIKHPKREQTISFRQHFRETKNKTIEQSVKEHKTKPISKSAQKAKDTRKRRIEISYLTEKDARLINYFNVEAGHDWNRLSERQQEQFANLFKKYPANIVREWLGSPPR